MPHRRSYRSLEAAISAFVRAVAESQPMTPSERRFAIFTGGDQQAYAEPPWEIVMLAGSSQLAADCELTWAANRLARILNAAAAAEASREGEHLIVRVERRGATNADVFTFAQGGSLTMRTTAGATFDLVYGGVSAHGWGRAEDHDRLRDLPASARRTR